jgi:hypothetical protein
MLVPAPVPASATTADPVVVRAPLAGDAVSAASVVLTPNVAGAAAAEYAVTFTLSRSGDLAAGKGAIQLVAPPGTTLTQAATLVDHTHPSESDTNLLEGYNTTISDNGTVFTMIVGKEMYADDTLTVTVYGATNALRSGSYDLRLWTSADGTPAILPFDLRPPSSAVIAPSVQLSSAAPGATDVTYTVAFTTSTGGGMPPGYCLSNSGGAIDVSFPLGTGNVIATGGASNVGIQARLTDVTDASESGSPECAYADYQSPWVSADGAVVAFPLSNPVGPSNKLDLTFTDVTNPMSAGAYSLLLWTTSDPMPVKVTYQVGSSSSAPSSVGSASLGVSPSTGAGTSTYTAEFTTSSNGALAASTGIIYLLTAAGTSFSGAGATVTDTSTGRVGTVPSPAVGVYSTNELVYFPSPVAVGAGDHVVVKLTGVTDAVAGSYSARIWTSTDARMARATYLLTAPPPPSAVTPGSLGIENGSLTGWSGLTYSATFAVSAAGGLQAKTGAIYLQGPVSVDLSSGGCADSFFCSVYNGPTVSVVDLTRPTETLTVASEQVPPDGPATVLAVTLGESVPAGDLLTVTVLGVPLTGSAAAGVLTLWTSQDVMPVTMTAPATAGGFVYGKVTAFVGVSSVNVQLCEKSGGICIDTLTLPKSSSGEFSALVPPGTYTATAIPPTNLTSQYTEQASGPVTVLDGRTGNPVVLSFTAALPASGTFTGFPAGAQTGISPSVYASFPSTYGVSGCKNGYGLLTVAGTDPATGDPVSRSFPLVETPPGSGTYLAQLGPLGPMEGVTSVHAGILCPGQSRVFPNGGEPAGGNSVLIIGTGFASSAKVMFGSRAASAVKVADGSLITAVAPPGSGTVSVRVVDGGSTETIGSFTYFGVSGLSVASGPFAGGTSVTIHGEGFTDVRGVVFGLLPAAAFTVLSPTEIRATAPPGVGTIDVQVLNGLAVSETDTADYFTYKGSGSSTRPDEERTDQPGGINEGTGDGSVQGLGIQLGGVCSDPSQLQQDQQSTGISWSGLCNTAEGIINSFGPGGALEGVFESALAAIVVGIGASLLGVAVGAALALGAVTFVLLLVLGLWQLFNLWVDPSGTIVDTTGNPLPGASASILSKQPAGSSFVPVPAGGSISPPINPETTGPSGGFDWLALAGSYEIGASATGCHAPGRPSVSEVTTKPFVIPPPAVGLLLTLSCPGSKPARPSVTGLSPAVGPATSGIPVDVLGTGLGDITSVRFGNTLGTDIHVLSPDAIEVTPPAGTGTVDVRVSGPGGSSTTSNGARFAYAPGHVPAGRPAVTHVSPASGPIVGGSTIEITGRLLKGVTSVLFGGTPSLGISVGSATKLTAVVPAGLRPGEVSVVVSGSAGSSGLTPASRYTYLAPAIPRVPPAPLGLKVQPGDGSATLNWTSPSRPDPSLTGYRISWTAGNGSPATENFGGSSSKQIITGLVDGTPYRFRLALENTAGYGPWSAWSSATILRPRPLGTLAVRPSVGPTGDDHDPSVSVLVSWPPQPAGSEVTVCVRAGQKAVGPACSGGVVETVASPSRTLVLRGLRPVTAYRLEGWRFHRTMPNVLSNVVVVTMTGASLAVSLSAAGQKAGATVVSLRLGVAGTSKSLGNQSVQLWSERVGSSTWAVAVTRRTARNGRVSVVVKPTAATRYQWRYGGSTSHRQLGGFSAVETVRRG